MPERLVSIKEAAELLGVSKSRLRAWDDNGKFSAVRTPGGQRRYRLSDIRRFQGLVEQEDGKTDAVAAYLRVSFHEGTGPMKTAREIAARIWCDLEMSKVAMDVDAAEAIAKIIYDVRRNQADAQSYTDLAASGDIVDAP